MGCQNLQFLKSNANIPHACHLQLQCWLWRRWNDIELVVVAPLLIQNPEAPTAVSLSFLHSHFLIHSSHWAQWTSVSPRMLRESETHQTCRLNLNWQTSDRIFAVSLQNPKLLYLPFEQECCQGVNPCEQSYLSAASWGMCLLLLQQSATPHTQSNFLFRDEPMLLLWVDQECLLAPAEGDWIQVYKYI